MISMKEDYLLRRRRKKIRTQDIASYIGCSQSLISRYETGSCGMCAKKIKSYRKYIDTK